MSDPFLLDLSMPSALPKSPTVKDELSSERYFLRPRRVKRGAYKEDEEGEEGEMELEEDRGGGSSWFKKRSK